MRTILAQSVSLSQWLASSELTDTADTIRTVILHPDANTSLFALLLAAAAVFVLLLVMLVAALVTPSRKRVVKIRTYYYDDDEVPGEDAHPTTETTPGPGAAVPEPSRLGSMLTSLPVVTVLVFLALAGAYVTTSTNQYCLSCHSASRTAIRANTVDHAYCISCHEDPPVVGALANISSRTRMLLSSSRVTTGEIDAVTHSTACLRCHHEVSEQTVTVRGVRMSHREVIANGRPCTTCHERVGHVRLSPSGSMDDCLSCHDSRQASAACSTCHANDPGAIHFAKNQTAEKRGSARFEYPGVRAAKRECGGCHDQERQCDPCHGIRMPHTRDFIDGRHAVNAAFEKKLSCWKCHDPQSCSGPSCHTGLFDPKTGTTSHAAGWKAEHTRSSWDDGCVCHSGRSRRETPICFRCHARDHSLLKPEP